MRVLAGVGALVAVAVAARASDGGPHVEFWAFAAPWDARSSQSVAAHAPQLSAVVSGWFALDSVSAAPIVLYPDTAHVPATTRRFALVTTYVLDRFHPEVIRQLASDASRMGGVAGQIASMAGSAGYRGLVLDFEGHIPADTSALGVVVQAITDSAHAHGITPVSVAVPPADTVAYGARVLQGADFLLVMLYDEHWATSSPGAIASPDWVRRMLAARITEAGAGRIVASLPTYGYEWTPGATAAVIGYDDAERFARDAGIPLTRDSASATLYAARPDSAEVWTSDAHLLETLVADAQRAGVTHFAFWRLGTEDPHMWAKVIE